MLAVAFDVSPASKRSQGKNIDAVRYLSDVQYLASGELNGRETGTPEFEKAAKFIAQAFHRAGLAPVNGRTYLQTFEVTRNSRMEGVNRMRATIGTGTAELKPGTDFLPCNFSGSGSANGEVVFAGYGITAPEYGYDDYANVDVRGRLALILRHEPQEYDSQSVFEGRIYTEHSQMDAKAENARLHGARAVLLVNDTANHSGSDTLDKLSGLTAPANPGIPVRAGQGRDRRRVVSGRRQGLPSLATIDRRRFAAAQFRASRPQWARTSRSTSPANAARCTMSPGSFPVRRPST